MSVTAVSDASGLPVDASVKAGRVQLLATIVLIGSVTAIAFHYAVAFYLVRGYPWSTFLFIPIDHFNDWRNPYLWAQTFLEGQPTTFAYYPLAFLVFSLATIVPARVGFTVLVALFAAAIVYLVRRWMVDALPSRLTKIQCGFILVVLSYPVLFAVDRGNLELLVFVCLGGFFYSLYVRGSWWVAAIFLGAAIALKLYPATLLVLLLAERRFRATVLSVLVALGLTVGSTIMIALLGHVSVATVLQENIEYLNRFQHQYVLNGEGIQHGHSLWGLFRLPWFLAGSPIVGWQMALYGGFAAIVTLAIAAYSVFRETERWKRVLYAVALALLLPFSSSDYTLLWMYFPLVFFINGRRISSHDTAFVALFGLLMIPLDYWYLAPAEGVSTSVILYPLAMVAMVGFAIIDRDRARLEDVTASPRSDGTAGSVNLQSAQRDVGAARSVQT